MSKSFYIASSSLPKYRERVKALAAKLIAAFGWNWHNNWDWNDSFDNREEYTTRDALIRCSQMDKEGARDCDVFIYIEPAAYIVSRGSDREYGVRWGMGLLIYRIEDSSAEHIFDMTPLIISFPDEDNLIEYLSKNEVK